MDTRAVKEIIRLSGFVMEKGKGGETRIKDAQGRLLNGSFPLRHSTTCKSTYSRLRRNAKKLGYDLPSVSKTTVWIREHGGRAKKPVVSHIDPASYMPPEEAAQAVKDVETISVKEGVILSGVSQPTVNKHCGLGTFKAEKVDGRWRIDKQSFKEALDKGKIWPLKKEKVEEIDEKVKRIQDLETRVTYLERLLTRMREVLLE